MTKQNRSCSHRYQRVLGLLAAAACLATLVSIPPAVAETKIVDTSVAVLDGWPTDVEVDAERGLIYVSIRDEDQIVVIDSTHGTIVEEHFISKPAGLDLSRGGDFLYVAQYMATGVVRIDLDDWSTDTVTLPKLGDPRTQDVAEVAPGIILVTANPSSGSAYVVRYDFSTNAEDVVANNLTVSTDPWIFVDDDERYAYVGEPYSLYKLDLGLPHAPVIAHAGRPATGMNQLAFAPDGSFVITSGGQQLRTSDLEQIGSFPYGAPAVSPDGTILYALREGTEEKMPLHVTSADSAAAVDEWDIACPADRIRPTRLYTVPGSADMIAATPSAVCIIHTETARLRPLPPGGRFLDDDDIVHEPAIEAIAIEGITTGCNPPKSTAFCPSSPVTRGQMAAFLSRALALPGGGASPFTDDDGSVFEADISRLAAAGITKGCNPPDNTMFCPDASVSRGQMAAFLVRAMGYSATDSDVFVDDDGSVFENAIDALAASGVTRGCNPPDNTMFCPNAPVTRAQMATFLARALGLDIRATTSRPTTTSGTHLNILAKAAAAGCSPTSGEPCGTAVHDVAGAFYLLSGWYAEDWSTLSQTERSSFDSPGVRLEATLDGIPLHLFERPLEIIDDTAHKLYSFQFPDWLAGVYILDATFVDEANQYTWTVRVSISMASDQPGYLQGTPAAVTPDSDLPAGAALAFGSR